VGIALFLAALLSEGIREAERARPLQPGGSAPSFALPVMGGGEVSLEALAGNVVMLDFWATWCAPCVQEIPLLVRVAAEFEARGVSLVLANRIQSDSVPRVEAFMKKRLPPKLPENVSIALAQDAVFDAYEVHALPTLVFIGRSGTVLRVQEGLASEQQLREWLSEALAAP
jgi:thiol-disulfide isomerase/thioredoxin